MVRDVVTLTVGLTLCLSQVVIQIQGGEPNVAMLTAGVGLLTSWPFLKLGDRRVDESDDHAPKTRVDA